MKSQTVGPDKTSPKCVVLSEGEIFHFQSKDVFCVLANKCSQMRSTLSLSLSPSWQGEKRHFALKIKVIYS